MIIAVIIVAIILVWFIGTMNGLRTKQLKVEEAASGIDVALQKRFDSLTKMFDMAKSYATFEKETILEAVKLRQGMSMAEKNEADGKMNSAMREISVIAEQYPQLQSNQQFVVLQKEIADVEEHLQAARRAYNANVTALNTGIITFPSSIVAGMLHIEKEEFFEAEAEKKQDVNMSFTL